MEDNHFPIILDFTGVVKKLSDKHLLRISSNNPELRFETDGLLKLIITHMTGSKTSNKNAKILIKIGNWTEENDSGEVFESNAGFRLPVTQSVKSPDVAWISKELLASIDKDAEGFYLIAPDLAVELMSESDRLAVAQAKMDEYMKNGVRLAWLIQPKKRKTWVYAQNSEVKEQSFDVPLSGQDVLVGFELDLSKIF